MLISNSNALRIIHVNLVDDSTVTAANVAANLPVSNLKNDDKNKLCRVLTRTPSFNLVFPSTRKVGAVSLRHTNLTEFSQVRITGWSNAAMSAFVFSTDWISARVLKGATNSTVWLNSQFGVMSLRIEVRDPTNPSSYIDIGRMVVGEYWAPETSADLGVQVGHTDMSVNSRAESGALRSSIRPSYKTLQLQLSALDLDEGAVLADLFKRIGIHKPILLSLYPNYPDLFTENLYEVYGKQQRSNPISMPYYRTNQANIAVEEC